MPGTELVGPLRTIRFQDGSRRVYDGPRDSCDPRYRNCRLHHPACDCREAEFAELLAEFRHTEHLMRHAAAELLVGHRLYDHGTGDRVSADDETYWRYLSGDGPLACQCAGCRLARAGDLFLLVDERGIVLPEAAERAR